MSPCSDEQRSANGIMNTRISKRAPSPHLMMLALAAFGFQACGQNGAELRIETYAGLTITGTVGQVYAIECVNQPERPEDWKCVEFVQLLENLHLWIDKSALIKEKRFNRAVQMDAPEAMVWIPPGTFRMGSPTNELHRYEIEGPQTAVIITRGFWMGKHEVTQGEYLDVMGENPSWFNGIREWPQANVVDYGSGLNRPVECVTRAAEAVILRLHRQAAVRRRDANVRGIIAREVLALGADNDGDDQRQSVDGIRRQNQDGPAPGLLPTVDGVEVNKVDFAALDGHQCLSSPSASVTMNSAPMQFKSRWTSGSAAIAARSDSQVSSPATVKRVR